MRLIDADALLDEVMDRYCEECDKRKGIKNGRFRIIYEIGDAPCRACEVDDMKTELEDAPTIEPVKHGRWIKLYQGNYKCSECGDWWATDDEEEIKTFRYCPNCGASMESMDEVEE